MIALSTAVLLTGAGCGVVHRGAAPPAAHPSSLNSEFPSYADSNQSVAVPSERKPAEASPGLPAERQPSFATDHPRVQDFVDWYQTHRRKHMAYSLERGVKYLPRITKILLEEGVPPELAYLPIVESGFRVDAVSHAGAVGPWQFVRGTGRRYGLRIDGYVDERRDPEKATRAAARYLRDLYGQFGDWLLSLAAYNTGEGKIRRVLDQWNVDDYWEMSERGYLPAETCDFVPRVLAAMQIAQSPEEHGFEAPPIASSSYDVVYVSEPLSLRSLAQLSQTSVATLSELNPALRRGVIPPYGYTMRLPRGRKQIFEAARVRLRQQEAATWSMAGGPSHRVRRGETPAGIARRYGVPVHTLMRANGIHNPRRLRVGKVLRIPVRVSPARRQNVALHSTETYHTLN
jgi:membrane-bound lytic murein transglycosylase D